MHNRPLLFLLAILLSLPTALQAQDNVLKINLPNLVNRHLTLHLEHAFHDRMSLGVIVGYTPGRNLPGSNLVKSLFLQDVESTNFQLDGKYTKFALTPEFRYYFLRQKDAPEGLYAAVALRYARHAFDLPFSFTPQASNPLTVSLDARLHTIGGTLSLGYQFFILDRISVDIYLGAGLAITPTRLQASSTVLTSDDYIELRDSILAELNLNVNPDRLEKWVSNQELKISFAIPMPLVRTGFSVGYRF